MGIEIEEIIDYTKLRFIQEAYTFDMFKSSVYSDFKSANAAKEEYKKIMEYVDYKLRSPTNFVTYDFVNRKTNGRLYCQKSIQNVKKNIRGFFADHTIDIDIKNAHPCILWNVCRKNNINCPSLERYVKSRDEVLQEICDSDSIDYDEAKKTILQITNANVKTTYKTHNNFVKGYIKEIKAIRSSLLGLSEYDHLKDFAKHEKGNFEGSFTNHILCLHENEILTAMRHYTIENGFKIFALMFDGLMIYKHESKCINLDFMEEYIQDETSFENIHLAFKEHKTDISIPPDFELTEKPDYEKCKELFEKDCCKVKDHFYSEECAFNRSNFLTLYEDKYYWDKGIPQPFIKRWLIDPEKRSYKREDSYPKADMCPTDTYNLWVPFACLKTSMTDPVAVLLQDYIQDGIDFFFNHIKILCGHDENITTFVIFWLAQMFQYPENKTIELIFISNEGAGKGFFRDVLFKLIGLDKIAYIVDPQADLFGNFNDQMLKSFLIIFEETNRSGTYGKNDIKKSYITDPYIVVRQKGLPSLKLRSYHRLMSFTNHPNPSNKNKRRDIFIRSSDEKIADTEYFNRGYAYISNDYVIRGIYNHLMSLKIKSTIVESDIPSSNFDIFIKNVQRNPIARFLEHFSWTHTGAFDRTPPSLYEEFISFKGANHMTFNLEIDNFILGIASANFKGCQYVRSESGTGRPYVFKLDCELLRWDVKINN